MKGLPEVENINVTIDLFDICIRPHHADGCRKKSGARNARSLINFKCLVQRIITQKALRTPIGMGVPLSQASTHLCTVCYSNLVDNHQRNEIKPPTGGFLLKQPNTATIILNTLIDKQQHYPIRMQIYTDLLRLSKN